MLKEHIAKMITAELQEPLKILDERIKRVEEYEKRLIATFDDIIKNIDSAVREEIQDKLKELIREEINKK